MFRYPARTQLLRRSVPHDYQQTIWPIIHLSSPEGLCLDRGPLTKTRIHEL
jgi:hypothetical protein